MRQTEAPEVLEYTVQQVVETMCFSEAPRVAEPLCEERVIGTTIRFSGDLRGYLRLEIASDAASSLTQAFLGLHDPSNADETVGTVQELGNVICGRFLSLLHPSAGLSIRPPVPEAPVYSPDLVWLNFRAESGPLRVAVRFDSMDASDGR